MKMRKCRTCGIYTFKEVCPKCGRRTSLPIPPKYSPEDKFGKYRRKLIREIEKGVKFIITLITLFKKCSLVVLKTI